MGSWVRQLFVSICPPSPDPLAENRLKRPIRAPEGRTQGCGADGKGIEGSGEHGGRYRVGVEVETGGRPNILVEERAKAVCTPSPFPPQGA